MGIQSTQIKTTSLRTLDATIAQQFANQVKPVSDRLSADYVDSFSGAAKPTIKRDYSKLLNCFGNKHN